MRGKRECKIRHKRNLAPTSARANGGGGGDGKRGTDVEGRRGDGADEPMEVMTAAPTFEHLTKLDEFRKIIVPYLDMGSVVCVGCTSRGGLSGVAIKCSLAGVRIPIAVLLKAIAVEEQRTGKPFPFSENKLASLPKNPLQERRYSNIYLDSDLCDILSERNGKRPSGETWLDSSSPLHSDGEDTDGTSSLTGDQDYGGHVYIDGGEGGGGSGEGRVDTTPYNTPRRGSLPPQQEPPPQSPLWVALKSVYSRD